MCGIAGKVVFNGSVVDHSLIHAMCEAILHRGPDAEGTHVGSFIGLGQRRLSVIDLSNEATPPLANEDKTIWLVFNGEIYNFEALRSDLQKKGHVFRTRTDTEVIIHLYEEYGVRSLDHLRGMFSFALWDSRRHQLFAARDRIGKKPFYYAKSASSLTFGSSISALLVDDEIPVSPDYVAIDQYLRWQYVPSPLTAFKGISKLPAAHYLICNADGELVVSRYWAPTVGDVEQDLTSRKDIKRALLDTLGDAVRLRMVSDVPLGALLSGGIDSGSVVALMAMESSRPVKTFSVGFEGDSHNELPFARSVAERYGTDHHEFLINASVVDLLPLLVRHYGEPFADSSAVPTYFVSQMARQHVTVALSGDGGDESFSGYDRYGELLQWEQLERIPLSYRSRVCGSLASMFQMLPYGRWTSRLSRGCRMAASSTAERYKIYMSVFKDEERQALYSPVFQALLANSTIANDVVLKNSEISPLDWMMNYDQRNYLPDCLMVKTDVASMANSLELRSPFLDHEFIQFAARIPSSLKRHGMNGKILLKEAVSDLLPYEVLNKPKTGFGVPLAQWFRNELSDMLRGTLLDERAEKRNLFNHAVVHRMVDEQIAGRRDWSNRLWALMYLELWFREFID